jgi:hypothetical protein
LIVSHELTFAAFRASVRSQPVHRQATRRATRFCIGSQVGETGVRLRLVGYLLGIMVGDASKRKPSSLRKMFIELQLTKRHPDNVRLGEFVGLCANAGGVRFNRIADRFVGPRVPYGRFHWKSENSEFIYWLFTRCLGLGLGELTTWNPVNLEWILRSPRYFRIWFLQGLADSDGYVHLENREVHVIVSPNAELMAKVLTSLGIRYSRAISKGLDILRISIDNAWRLPIFSPYVKSYRFRLVERLASAKRLRRGPWPSWLVLRVEILAKRNLTTKEIMLDILSEHNLFIRAANVRRHTKYVRLNIPMANKGINRQIGRGSVGP